MLTDIEVKKAKAQHKPYKLSDSGNMYLWVTPSGGKIWRWAYRWEGKEKLMVLGKYPAVSLALARGRRDEAKALLATGTDPMAVRKVEKAAEQVANENSFASIADEWLKHWQVGKAFAMWIQRVGDSIPTFCRVWDRSKLRQSTHRILWRWSEPSKLAVRET